MKLPLKKVPENIELNLKQIDILFKFAKLGKKDIFYDLGSGRGNLVLRAFTKYHVRKAIGFEIEKFYFDISIKKLLQFSRKIPIGIFPSSYEEFDDDNRYIHDISDATVVFNSLQHTEDELTFYKTQFRGKKVKILKKVIPLIGYLPTQSERSDKNFWFFTHETPLRKLRTTSKTRWSEAVLDQKNSTITDVHNYFDKHLKNLGFRVADRKETINELKHEVKKMLPNR